MEPHIHVGQELEHDYAGSGCPPRHVVLQPSNIDAHPTMEGKHASGPGTMLTPNHHGSRQFSNAAPKAPIFGIPRNFPELPMPPLSPSSSMTSSTRSTSPDCGYSFGHVPMTRLPSVDDVLCTASDYSRSRTPSHNRQSMSMDSAVVLEMDGMSVTTEKYDDAASDHDDDRFSYSNVGDDAVDLSTDDPINSVRDGLERVSLGEPRPVLRRPVPVFVDEDASDDDTCTVVSDSGMTQDIDRVLAFSLPVALGMNVEDLPQETIARCQTATADYLQLLSGIVEHSINGACPDQTADQSDGTGSGSGTSPSGGDFSRSNSQSTSEKSGRARNSRKRRKSSTGRDNDNDDDDDLDVEGGHTSRQKKQNTGLRLRCCFRARNPCKFNVRDHYSCAMSYFSTFADLRQHILKKHSREDPLQFVCGRCNQSYKTKKELEIHVRVPASLVCDLVDLNPEDGIDSATAQRIIDRRRSASGPTDQDQWNDLWALVFPEDDMVPSYGFQAVIEHFELAQTFVESIQYLQPSLNDLNLSHDVELELCKRILENFKMAMDKWDIQAREMDYVNRQSNRNSGVRPPLSTLAEILPARDSGVFMETGSTRSNSFIRPASGTPVSAVELLPRSSTGSFRSSQGYQTRRPSSVIHQQPRPHVHAHQLGSEMLQSDSRTAFHNPKPMQPAYLPSQDTGIHGQMFEGYSNMPMTENGPGPHQAQFMDLGGNVAIPGDYDALLYDETGPLNLPYHLVSGPAIVPGHLPQQTGHHHSGA